MKGIELIDGMKIRRISKEDVEELSRYPFNIPSSESLSSFFGCSFLSILSIPLITVAFLSSISFHREAAASNFTYKLIYLSD